jgi:hypothetical protein
MTPMAWVVLRGAIAFLFLAYLVVRLVQAFLHGVTSSPIGRVYRHQTPSGFWVMIGWRILMIALFLLVTPIIVFGLGFTGGI